MLNAGAYSTADRLSAFMGITTPTGTSLTAMEALINAATGFIENYTSRKFKKATYTQLELDTERGQIINLPYYPVISTSPIILERRNSQLKEDKWETIDQLYYDVDNDSGIIHMMDGVYLFRGRKIYRITYTAGYDFDNSSTFLGDTLAGDVEVALWIMVQDVWKNKGVPANLYAEQIGDYKVTYQRPVKGATGFMFDNQQALAILDKYVDISPVGVLTPLQSI